MLKEKIFKFTAQIDNEIDDFITVTVNRELTERNIKVNTKKIAEAVEKQIPQKVRYLQPLTIDTVVGGLKTNKSASIITECPNCRNRARKNNKYCNECGQKLDWSDDDD